MVQDLELKCKDHEIEINRYISLVHEADVKFKKVEEENIAMATTIDTLTIDKKELEEHRAKTTEQNKPADMNQSEEATKLQDALQLAEKLTEYQDKLEHLGFSLADEQQTNNELAATRESDRTMISDLQSKLTQQIKMFNEARHLLDKPSSSQQKITQLQERVKELENIAAQNHVDKLQLQVMKDEHEHLRTRLQEEEERRHTLEKNASRYRVSHQASSEDYRMEQSGDREMLIEEGLPLPATVNSGRKSMLHFFQRQ
eukprot:Ihof_evm1s1170 gene=Ihof_evmTU1s1170